MSTRTNMSKSSNDSGSRVGYTREGRKYINESAVHKPVPGKGDKGGKGGKSK